jgi:hypothetical protein
MRKTTGHNGLRISETNLVKACLDLLTAKRIFHYRQNSGALKTERGGFVRFGAVGVPDIIAVINGKYIGIECKVGKNKQSEGQKEFEVKLKKAGGDYWLIYFIDELLLKLS